MILFRGKRESATVYLFDLVLLVWFLEIAFPPMAALPVKRAQVCLTCAIVSIFLYLAMRVMRIGSLPVKSVMVLAVFFLMILLPYMAGNTVIGNRYMAMALVFLGPVIFDFYRENDLLGHLKTILCIVGAFALVSGIITYSNLQVNSYISRNLAASGEESIELQRRGIGGYLLIYFVTAVSLPVLFIFLNEKNKRLKKWFCLLLFVFCLLLIVKSNYMTAFVTVLFCSLLMVFLYLMQGRGMREQLLLLLVLAVFFIVVINLDRVLALFEDFIPKRIESVLYSSDRGIAQSIFAEFQRDRWPTILTSLKVFAEHPLLGLCFSGTISYNSGGYLVGFGQHSFIADTFALFGIVFGAACLWIIFRPVKFYHRERVNALSWAMLFCIFALYFFNNATESIALAVGVVYPLVRELQRERPDAELQEEEGEKV